jgi:flagellar basal-body rod protein FlgC
MSTFSMLEISAGALSAERQRAEVVAANMANSSTTHTPEGGPYRRKEVVFASSKMFPFQLALNQLSSLPGHGSVPSVRISRVVNDPNPPQMRYEPGHPPACDLQHAAGYQPGCLGGCGRQLLYTDFRL